MSETEKTVEIQIDEDLYELLSAEGDRLGLSVDEVVQDFLTRIIEDVRRDDSLKARGVKVEFKIPQNLYRAIELVCGKFGIPMEKYMAEALENEARSLLSNNFEEFVLPLKKLFKEILEG